MNTTSKQEGDQGRNLEREKKRKTYDNTGFEPGTCGLAAPDLNNYIGYGATTPMKYIKGYIFLHKRQYYSHIFSTEAAMKLEQKSECS